MYLLTSVSHFFDAAAFLLVLVGSFLIALFRSTAADILRAFKAFRPLLTAKPEHDGEMADRALQAVLQQTKAKGIATADRIDITFAPLFLQKAVGRLTDCRDPDDFRQWITGQLEKRKNRHQGAINFWYIVGDVAPSVAMIGTVVGLVNMFSHLSDVNSLGPSMAMAILTTLYGLCLSTLIAAPIAGRLEYLSDIEGQWWKRVADMLVSSVMEELKRPAIKMPPVKSSMTED